MVVDLTVNETEEADEFDMERCCNYGSPIKVEWDGKVHDFIDGFGLCSPTRWHPRARGHKRSLKMKQLASQTFQCLQDGVSEALQDVRLDAFKLVTGKLQSSPFTEELLMKVRTRMHVLFGTKMIALLLGSMVFCIGNAKHVDLLRLLGLI